MKKSKARGFQKNSILYVAKKILEEENKPLSYEELYEISLEKDYRDTSSLKNPGVFRHRVKEDITRRQGDSIFQITGYRQIGLKEWDYPEFDEEEYKEKLLQEKLANKKVSIVTATIEALEKSGHPLRVKEIFEYVSKRKNVIFKTKTPFKTVNSNITHEINKKGDNSRFTRISKGLIGLRKWYKNGKRTIEADRKLPKA